MSKTAVLFSGNLGPCQLVIENLMEKLIGPSDADIFILTSRKNYVHCRGDHLHNDYFPVNEEDLTKIKTVFGDHVKSIIYIEDIDDYEKSLESETEDLHNKRISWLTFSEKRITFFDKEQKRFTEASYVDQWLRLKYALASMEQYETSHNFQYDFIVKTRIDVLLDFEWNIPDMMSKIREGNEEILCLQTTSENAFYGTRNSMAKVCDNFVHEIGKFDNEHIFEKVDYRVGPEAQWSAYIKTIDTKLHLLAVFVKWRYFFNEDGKLFHLDTTNSEEAKRLEKEMSIKEYYKNDIQHTNKSIPTMMGNKIWGAYLLF